MIVTVGGTSAPEAPKQQSDEFGDLGTKVTPSAAQELEEGVI